jgi:tRNA threonylcarbamoyladenosine biosynthesis protein TsaB
MYLLIDLSTRDMVSLRLYDADALVQSIETPGKNVDLLTVIADALAAIHISPEQLGGIAVVVGSGTFTGTRLAVTVANTFAFANKTKVVTISEHQKEDFSLQRELFAAAVAGEFISATYSGMPRIGNS